MSLARSVCASDLATRYGAYIYDMLFMQTGRVWYVSMNEIIVNTVVVHSLTPFLLRVRRSTELHEAVLSLGRDERSESSKPKA